MSRTAVLRTAIAAVAMSAAVAWSGGIPGVTKLKAKKFSWNLVTQSAPTASGNGYLTDSGNLIELTLPAEPPLGSILQITGAGSGGWKLKQNPGQYVVTERVDVRSAPSDFEWHAIDEVRQWTGVASSADGRRLIGCLFYGQLSVSADGGATWTLRASNHYWTGVASSADGIRLAATVSGGKIHVSPDSGVTWSPQENDRDWVAIASSASGNRHIAAVNGGVLYTSLAGGLIWLPTGPVAAWRAVASSADGMTLAAVADGFNIVVSTNGGASWEARETGRPWTCIAMSADGQRMVAAASVGQIYVSTDRGLTWTPREENHLWTSIACSADGMRIVANATGHAVFSSYDGGATWVMSRSGFDFPAKAACTADGSQYFVAANLNNMFTATGPSLHQTTEGPNGYLVGGPNSAIELQYAGDGKFIPISAADTLSGH